MTIEDYAGRRWDGEDELRLHSAVTRVTAWRNRRLLDKSVAEEAGCAARVRDGEMHGFCSIPGLDAASIAHVRAEAAQRLVSAGRKQEAAPASSTLLTLDHRSKWPGFMDEDRITFLRRLEEIILPHCRNLSVGGIVLEEFSEEKFIRSFEGARFYTYTPRTSLILILYTQHQGRLLRMAEIAGRLGEVQDALPGIENDLLKNLPRICGDLEAKADAVSPLPGEHDVVVAAGLSGLIAHEAIGHMCEADNVRIGSGASRHLGEIVASEKVSITDEGGRGFDQAADWDFIVDDEGTPCQPVSLIDRGRLSGILHDRRSAARRGTAPTGNARSEKYGDLPMIRMRNTAIHPGSCTLAEMIGEIETGYYLTRATDGKADLNGTFNFGVNCCYEIRDGKLGKAVKDLVVAGTAFDVLGSVSHVGDDFEWQKRSRCRKGQTVPVCFGGPSIKTRLKIGTGR